MTWITEMKPEIFAELQTFVSAICQLKNFLKDAHIPLQFLFIDSTTLSVVNTFIRHQTLSIRLLNIYSRIKSSSSIMDMVALASIVLFIYFVSQIPCAAEYNRSSKTEIFSITWHSHFHFSWNCH